MFGDDEMCRVSAEAASVGRIRLPTVEQPLKLDNKGVFAPLSRLHLGETFVG